jgi:hypothetical protein
MKIVIQCARSKDPQAGTLKTPAGIPVSFVANPELVEEKDTDTIYQRPDDITDNNKSWRDLLLQYQTESTNPWNLVPTYKLYSKPMYTNLVEKFGEDNIFVLSAGWGLINASFLLPKYDITFSNLAAKHVIRKPKDLYLDFCFLPLDTDEDLLFLGGKDYLPSFIHLTSQYKGRKIIMYNSKSKPKVPKEYYLIKYDIPTNKTNWHYDAGKQIINEGVNFISKRIN